MGDGLINEWRRLVFEWLGLDPDRTPRVDRLALYRARVDVCASDGSTVDVTPEDSRLVAMQSVPVRVSPPGAQWQVSPGARCLIGWSDGDDSKPYAMPAYDASATVVKLVLNGTTVILGAESGAQFVALANLVLDELNKIQTAHNTHVHILAGTTSAVGTPIVATAAPPVITYTAAPVAATQVKAK